jgi:uncharacterized membrane protein YfcA
VLLWRTTLLNELDVVINLWALGGTGLVAGLLGSILGIGGGPIIVPILALALRLPIQVAIGSSLVAIVANSCTATGMYAKTRLTNVKLGLLLETATIPGAIIGGLTVAFIAPSILSALFGLVLIYVAYTMVMPQRLMSVDTHLDNHTVEPGKISDNLSSSLADSYYDQNLGKVVSYKVNRIPAGLGVGFFAGVLSSLLGIGGGIIKVPVMHLVMRLPMKAAIATSAFMITITAAVGALLYHHNGYIYPFIVAPLVIGAVIGARVGVELTQRARGIVLRRTFGVFLLLVAVLMFLKTANVI